MRVSAKDIIFIILLVAVGLILAKIGVGIVTGLGSIKPIRDNRALIILSSLFGLLIGCAVGLILNIESRRQGLPIFGGLLVITNEFYRFLTHEEFYLGLIGGTVLSVLSVFRVIKFSISKIFKYILYLLYVVFLYSLFSPIINPTEYVTIIDLQNIFIIFIIGSIGFIIVARVI